MKEIQSVSRENISWKDIQGLSWILEESNFELNDKFAVSAKA